MTDLHPSIADIEMPPQIEWLPRNSKGFPVPWFVAWVDGDPDFRLIKPHAIEQAVKHALCWLCGHELTQTATYVAGPMCGVNRTSAEPPSHHACADYAAKACPFLARPHAVRRDITNTPSNSPAGVMLDRNPGVAMLWRTISMPLPFDDGRGGTLFRLPDPIRVDWIAEGRDATHEEVQESLRTGLPSLKEMAQQEGPDAMAALYAAVKELGYHAPPRAQATA